jgi:hypothetical protein
MDHIREQLVDFGMVLSIQDIAHTPIKRIRNTVNFLKKIITNTEGCEFIALCGFATVYECIDDQLSIWLNKLLTKIDQDDKIKADYMTIDFLPDEITILISSNSLDSVRQQLEPYLTKEEKTSIQMNR